MRVLEERECERDRMMEMKRSQRVQKERLTALRHGWRSGSPSTSSVLRKTERVSTLGIYPPFLT
jgi:hypothetical protein